MRNYWYWYFISIYSGGLALSTMIILNVINPHAPSTLILPNAIISLIAFVKWLQLSYNDTRMRYREIFKE